MLKPTAEIHIGPYSLSYVNELSISSSWENLTDTAEISLPRRLKFAGEIISAGEAGLFQRGQGVNIKLGYEDKREEIFSGYLAGIEPGIPVHFRAEDELWKLKQTKVSKTYKSVSLPALLKDICPIPFKAVDAELGSFRIDRATVAQVLQELKSKYSLFSFFRGGMLYVGLAFWPELQRQHSFVFGKNIIKSNLEYKRAEDVQISVEAISILKDNTKLTAKVGAANGDQRTLHFYGITSEKELKAGAEEELKRLNFEGYRGSFEAFGWPRVRHGDKVSLKDDFFGHAPGVYLVKKTETKFGLSGYRQTIHLDRKI